MTARANTIRYGLNTILIDENICQERQYNYNTFITINLSGIRLVREIATIHRHHKKP